MATTTDFIEAQWLDLWQHFHAKGDSSVILNQIITKYSDPSRKYHDMSHLEHVLTELLSVRFLFCDNLYEYYMPLCWLFSSTTPSTIQRPKTMKFKVPTGPNRLSKKLVFQTSLEKKLLNILEPLIIPKCRLISLSRSSVTLIYPSLAVRRNNTKLIQPKSDKNIKCFPKMNFLMAAISLPSSFLPDNRSIKPGIFRKNTKNEPGKIWLSPLFGFLNARGFSHGFFVPIPSLRGSRHRRWDVAIYKNKFKSSFRA